MTETGRVPVAPEIYHEIVQKSLGCGDGARQGWKSGLEGGAGAHRLRVLRPLIGAKTRVGAEMATHSVQLQSA